MNDCHHPSKYSQVPPSEIRTPRDSALVLGLAFVAQDLVVEVVVDRQVHASGVVDGDVVAVRGAAVFTVIDVST